MECFPALSFSISAATRKARGSEKHGVDYYFISPEEFEQKIQNDEFLEWEMVYEGKYYGTLKSEMERIWQAGKIPVLDVDVHGAIHVKKEFPAETLTIFIEPPSIEALTDRLARRGTETPESIQARIGKAAYEISFKDQFDKVILNDDLARAANEAILVVETFLQ